MLKTPPKGRSLWKDAWKRLRKNKAAMAGFVFFGFVILAAILGPWLSSYQYWEPDWDRISHPPLVSDFEQLERRIGLPVQREDYRRIPLTGWHLNTHNWLGTDSLGRDMLVRLLYGGRVSLAVGFLAGLVSLFIGVLYGAISGYVGGRVDNLMMRAVDTLYAVPYIIFVILLMAFVGRSFVLLFVAIGAVSWLTTARIVRGQVISLKNSEFVEAAISSGSSHTVIVFKHLIPNALGPIIVYFSLIVPRLILEESFLSFLGLGVQAPMSSWGLMAADAQDSFKELPYLVIVPGFALVATLFSLNFIGDGLRDALDPQMKGK